MHRKEINERSPLRVLEQSIHGGLGRGNIGVIVARHGIGKTAFLVGIGLDDLMRAKKVLHVSLEHPLDRVCDFYDEIFTELARTQHLEDVWQVRLDVERNRRIHCFRDREFTPTKLREALEFLERHTDFVPAAIIIDGVDFGGVTPADLVELRRIAGERGAELWMSAVTHRESQRDGRGIPEPVAHLEREIDVILTMAHDGNGVHVGLHKDHDNPEVGTLELALDPTTMLLVRE
jgi:hypothetical protein